MPESMLMLQHQGRHLRLSCLRTAKSPAKSPTVTVARNLTNSPLFINLLMGGSRGLGRNIYASHNRRREKGAGSKRVGGTLNVFVEGVPRSRNWRLFIATRAAQSQRKGKALVCWMHSKKVKSWGFLWLHHWSVNIFHPQKKCSLW